MLNSILEKQFFALERLYKMNLQSDTIFSMLKDCRCDFEELKPEYIRALQTTFELNIASVMIEKALQNRNYSETSNEMITGLASVALPKVQSLAKYFTESSCSLSNEVIDYCMVAELYFEFIIQISTLNLNTAMINESIKNTKGVDIVNVENNLITLYLTKDLRKKISDVEKSFKSKNNFNAQENQKYLQLQLSDADLNKKMQDSNKRYENVKEMIDPVKYENYTIESIKNTYSKGEDKILKHIENKVKK